MTKANARRSASQQRTLAGGHEQHAADTTYRVEHTLHLLDAEVERVQILVVFVLQISQASAQVQQGAQQHRAYIHCTHLRAVFLVVRLLVLRP